MSKAVLASLKPYYYYLVGEGIKKIEVRKTTPKANNWDKQVWFYMSKDEKSFAKIPKEYQEKYRKHFGKVGLKFICDRIDEFTPSELGVKCKRFEALHETRLTVTEIREYLKGNTGYGWHISDLKIYDKPKELSEFKTFCRNAYCQDDYGTTTWFCKDGYGSCAVKDKEKEFPYDDECIYFDCPSVGGDSCEYEDYAYCLCDGLKPVTRPFQSWGYVEELQE